MSSRDDRLRGDCATQSSGRAKGLGIATIDIVSSAGHDARFLHAVCPTGMIFVPCKDGISHNPLESAKPMTSSRAHAYWSTR
jgi:acetylornithine deacetylase/succinyl-diaminopimelate desuccinylase-like protein